MTISFNTIVLLIMTIYVIWMGLSEHRKERASEAGLTESQRQRFSELYALSRANADYPEDLRAHAAIAQRARIRKGAAVVILAAVIFIILFRGP
ncbi:hypothetical protein N0B44_15145 [Roseibacterium beibuensis]|uniref:Uncharacterized protein n=1 Tax=[Roseibacterium] beibuensis TaxID=1193142 RepID=A0ABP9LC58_9RHOB|nr:hypothetical protein [Roseibacterium beibuensis]MCS6624253.1 hypothetical protein [Roseibacterium beibuensis]